MQNGALGGGTWTVVVGLKNPITMSFMYLMQSESAKWYYFYEF